MLWWTQCQKAGVITMYSQDVDGIGTWRVVSQLNLDFTMLMIAWVSVFVVSPSFTDSNSILVNCWPHCRCIASKCLGPTQCHQCQNEGSVCSVIQVKTLFWVNICIQSSSHSWWEAPHLARGRHIVEFLVDYHVWTHYSCYMMLYKFVWTNCIWYVAHFFCMNNLIHFEASADPLSQPHAEALTVESRIWPAVSSDVGFKSVR